MMGGDWLPFAEGGTGKCCGDDQEEDLVQTEGTGRSCCHNGRHLNNLEYQGAIFCKDGRLYNCGGAATDDSGLGINKMFCDIVGRLLCQRDGNWGTGSGVAVSITGLGITRGGKAPSFSYYSNGISGGGIYNRGDLTLYDCDIRNNRAEDGASQDVGVYVIGPKSGSDGGGIYNEGVLTLNRVNVINNQAGNGGFGYAMSFSYGGWGGDGGGIYNAGTLHISESTIRYNSAGNGGDAENDDGWAGNGGSGGGIYSPGVLVIDRSTLNGNMSGKEGKLNSYQPGIDGNGGGICFMGNSLSITNSTISGNGTYGLGGGIIGSGGTVSITHSTITGNGERGLRANAGITRLKNSIVLGNSGSGDCYGSIASLGYNLVGTGCPANGPYDQTATDAKIGQLAANGGPTSTHALMSDSPAIDNGTCTDTNGNIVTIDQRGSPRPMGTCVLISEILVILTLKKSV